MGNLITIGEGSFAAQLLAKADVSNEARDAYGRWTAKLYHGSNTDFDVPLPQEQPEGHILPFGVHLTTSESVAATYGDKVKEYEVKFRNVFDATGEVNDVELAKELAGRRYTPGMSAIDAVSACRPVKSAQVVLENHGYDGIKYKHKGADAYVAIGYNQISPVKKTDVSGEPRDKEGKWVAGGEVQHLNAHKVTLREDGQQKEHVAELSEKVGDGPIENPIIAYKDHKGIHVIDGHHRTLVAREKGIPLPAIVISKAKYDQLQAEGHNDTKIKLAYAREQASATRNKPQTVAPHYLHGAAAEAEDKVTDADRELLKDLHKFEHVDILAIAKRDVEKADISDEARDSKGRWTKGDSDYLDAVKSGDVKEQQRMVTEAATKAGYSTSLYHGSDQQRDVFDGGIFFTDSKQDASAYAELRALHKAVDDNDDLSEIVYDVLAEQGGESLTDLGPKTIRDIADANGIELENVEGHVSKMFVKAENPLDLTEHGSDVGDVKGLWDDMHKAKLLDTPWKDLDEEAQYEIKDKYAGQALYRFLEEEGIQSKAFASGHDAVIFTDMSPDGGKTHNSWLVKSNTQFKSSAPITYDEDGKVIPLSKRFDSSSSDVRKTDVSEEARDKDGKWTVGGSGQGTVSPPKKKKLDLTDPNAWQTVDKPDFEVGVVRHGKDEVSGNHYAISTTTTGRFEVTRILPVEGAGVIGDAASMWGAMQKAHFHGQTHAKIKEVGEWSLKQLGSKNELVMSDRPYDFTLNGQPATAGGSYNPDTGKITLYTAALSKHGEELGFVKGLIAHEYAHHKWRKVFERYKKEEQASLDANHMRPSGAIPDEHKDKYPTYVKLHPLLDDHEKLRVEDGVTDYSLKWWADWNDPKARQSGFFSSRGIYTPIDETLAEIHRQTVETGNNGAKPHYRKLYLAVTQQFNRIQNEGN